MTGADDPVVGDFGESEMLPQAGRDQGSVAATRRLGLVLALLGSARGRTARELRESAHLGQTPTGRKALERDIEAIRTAGIHIPEPSGDPPRYLIETRPPADSQTWLTGEEFALASRAATVWSEQLGPSIRGAATAWKLASRADTATPAPLDARVAGGAHAAAVAQALSEARPISFTYVSRKETRERRVLPWHLAARGSALYLWGYDFDRDAPRWFRLSRIRGGIRPADAGDRPAVRPVSPDFGRLEIEPLLWVRPKIAPLTADACLTEILDQRGDWVLLRGSRRDVAFWEETVLSEATGAVAREPEWFARALRTCLERAQDWGGDA